MRANRDGSSPLKQGSVCRGEEFLSWSSSSSSSPLIKPSGVSSPQFWPRLLEKDRVALHALPPEDEGGRKKSFVSENEPGSLGSGALLRFHEIRHQKACLVRKKEQERRLEQDEEEEVADGGDHGGDQARSVREDDALRDTKRKRRRGRRERNEDGSGHRSAGVGTRTSEEEEEQGGEEGEERKEEEKDEDEEEGEEDVGQKWRGVRLVTCPLFYSNDYAHVGHVYSLVLADAFVRYARSRQGFYDPVTREGRESDGEEAGRHQGPETDVERCVGRRPAVERNAEEEAVTDPDWAMVGDPQSRPREKRERENEEAVSPSDLVRTGPPSRTKIEGRARGDGREDVERVREGVEEQRGEESDEEAEESQGLIEEEEEGCILLTGADEHGGKVVRAAAAAWRAWAACGADLPEETREDNDEREGDQISKAFERLVSHSKTSQASPREPSSSVSSCCASSFSSSPSSVFSRSVSLSPRRIVESFVDAISQHNLAVFRKFHLLSPASGALRFFRTSSRCTAPFAHKSVVSTPESLAEKLTKVTSKTSSSCSERLFYMPAKSGGGDSRREGGCGHGQEERVRRKSHEKRERKNQQLSQDARREREEGREEFRESTRRPGFLGMNGDDDGAMRKGTSTRRRKAEDHVGIEQGMLSRKRDLHERRRGGQEGIGKEGGRASDSRSAGGHDGGRVEDLEGRGEDTKMESEKRTRPEKRTMPRSRHEDAVWELWRVLERKGFIYQKASSSSSSASFLTSNDGACRSNKKTRRRKDKSERWWEGEEEEEQVWGGSTSAMLGSECGKEGLGRETAPKKRNQWIASTAADVPQSREEEEREDDSDDHVFYFRLTHFKESLLRYVHPAVSFMHLGRYFPSVLSVSFIRMTWT